MAGNSSMASPWSPLRCWKTAGSTIGELLAICTPTRIVSWRMLNSEGQRTHFLGHWSDESIQQQGHQLNHLRFLGKEQACRFWTGPSREDMMTLEASQVMFWLNLQWSPQVWFCAGFQLKISQVLWNCQGCCVRLCFQTASSSHLVATRPDFFRFSAHVVRNWW